MTKRFCDRCQAEVSAPTKLTDVIVPQTNGTTRKYELCTFCLHELTHWVQCYVRGTCY